MYPEPMTTAETASPRTGNTAVNLHGQSGLISVIIPTFNEVRRIGRCISRVRQAAKTEGPLEIIVADGGSDDGTAQSAILADRIVISSKGRSKQLNRGAEIARGEILFFLHATISLPDGALMEIRRALANGFDGGGFSNRFVGYEKKIQRLRKILSFGLGDYGRSDNLTFYGDNGIFVKRSVFRSLGGFADIHIMEDYEFSRRLAKSYSAKRIMSPRLAVSPRRHLKSGLLKTRLQWISVYSLYKLGLPTAWIRRIYSDPREHRRLQ